ncbi:NUDIX hydrolase [Aliidiomarina maris]|uniref:NUDIX domain-containing protein n=1 Tax=Aliidiomarina maris TaxID=531312 RepID=A0A327WV46_9GAMM|nr:NUDIX domain-containing protein [Aliidiomarina maris]RAJ92970.1 NUDIX domain-containing protein [Aliidiomarina maris]RUO18460.1 hypothetical protein CWE07_13990 [Aliidiomarina maris]
MAIKLIKPVEVYRNKFAVLYDDEVEFPNGSHGRYVRFCWAAPYGVALRVVNSDDALLLIRTFRHDSRCWTWQVPKGFGVDGLTPLACAQKELREETGLEASGWCHAHTYYEGSIDVHAFDARVEGAAMALDFDNNEAGEVINAARFVSRAECAAIVAAARPELDGDPVLDLISVISLQQFASGR